ncbi:MAG: TetR/AcrR family transcriptional regulator [Coriobacteriia bacterium]|nr:TetR/AcrR family transcriptional regulator [Coriobacteriia bacterium]
MSAARRKKPEVRRAELIAAAVDCFREKGVERTSVSDIVARAGVAQGTFYLYFKSKDEAIAAVVESALDGIIERLESAVDMPDASAVDKLFVLRDALVETADEPHEVEMLQVFHRPENRAVHDRVSAAFGPRIAPLIGQIIEQGVAEGAFDVEDPGIAAWFVLGGFLPFEASIGNPDLMERTMRQLTAYLLRGLGYVGRDARDD